MPLTPLHFGLLAPINHAFPGRISVVSFTLVTIWIDLEHILSALAGIPLPDHGIHHSFAGAMSIGVLVTIMGIRSRKWAFGAFFGALTHVLLDGLVHAELEPFYPQTGNPLYWGNMGLLSLILLPFMIWFIFQIVSYSLDWTRRRLADFQSWRYRP